MHTHSSLPDIGNFCRLLMTFANSLDPDQVRRNVSPDLDPNHLKVNFEKSQQTTTKLVNKLKFSVNMEI